MSDQNQKKRKYFLGENIEVKDTAGDFLEYFSDETDMVGESKNLDLGYPQHFVDEFLEKYLPRYIPTEEELAEKPSLKEEPPYVYATLLKVALRDPKERTLPALAKDPEIGYSLSSLTNFNNWYNWNSRLKNYDLAMQQQKTVHRMQKVRQYQDDVTSHLLGDYAKLRDVWTDELSRLSRAGELDAMQIKRLVDARKILDDLARRAVNLPNTISASVTDDIREENPDEYAYEITPDGGLKKVKVEKPNDGGL